MTERTRTRLLFLLLFLAACAVHALFTLTAHAQAPDTLAAPPFAFDASERLALWQDVVYDDPTFCGGNPRCVFADGTDAVRVVRTDGTVYVEFTTGGERYYSARADGMAAWETLRDVPPGSVGWLLTGFLTPAEVFADAWASIDEPPN